MLSSIMAPITPLLVKTRLFREFALDTATIKRLILLECRKNLSVLEALCISDEQLPQDAPAYVAAAQCIQSVSYTHLTLPTNREV